MSRELTSKSLRECKKLTRKERTYEKAKSLRESLKFTRIQEIMREERELRSKGNKLTKKERQ